MIAMVDWMHVKRTVERFVASSTQIGPQGCVKWQEMCLPVHPGALTALSSPVGAEPVTE
jgi:hypothetical protein